MRFLFHLIHRTLCSQELSRLIYKMSQEEFLKALNDFAKMGFLEKKTDPFGVKDDWYIVTDKGMQFYEEHRRFIKELPFEEDYLAHWIRFMGEDYVPPKAVQPENRTPQQFEQLDFIEMDTRLRKVHDTILERGGMARYSRSAPASLEEIQQVESKLMRKLPVSFRNTLLNYSGKLNFFWSLNNENVIVLKNEGVYTGYHEQIMSFSNLSVSSGGYIDGLWDLSLLEELEEEREGNSCNDSEVCSHWQDSLIFCRHGNGSYFGIKRSTGEVIYLSINMEMHGWRLGRNFESFLNQWSRVGCAGHWGEDFFLLSDRDTPYIHSGSLNGKLVRKWLWDERRGLP